MFGSAKLERDLKNWMIDLLNELRDVFAWSYEDIRSLNMDIVVHHLSLKPDYKRVNQKLRCMKLG